MKTVLALMSLVVAAALWVWFDAAQSRRAAVIEHATRAQREQELKSELRQWETKLATATRPPPVPIAPPAPPPAAPARKAPYVSPADKARAEAIAADPRLQLLDLERQRAQIALDYADFWATNGLSREQIDRFVAAKMKRGELGMDLAAVGAAQDPAGQRAVAALQERTEAEHDREIAQALGPDATRALQEHEHTRLLRGTIVHPLATAAALAGVPLTAAQGDRLTQAGLAAAGGAFSTAQPKIDLPALDAQARQILSPAQFEVYLRGAPHKRMEQTAALAKAQQADIQSAQMGLPGGK